METNGNTERPFYFEVKDGELHAFAGLWNGWKDPSGNWINTCLILTTTPNAVTATVHDRMPVILNPDSYDLWLNPRNAERLYNLRSVEALRRPLNAVLSRSFKS